MIGIFVMHVIPKEINMGGNVFVPRGNIIGIVSIYTSHIVLKLAELILYPLKSLSRCARCWIS